MLQVDYISWLARGANMQCYAKAMGYLFFLFLHCLPNSEKQ
jgi:hypothetical protein